MRYQAKITTKQDQFEAARVRSLLEVEVEKAELEFRKKIAEKEKRVRLHLRMAGPGKDGTMYLGFACHPDHRVMLDTNKLTIPQAAVDLLKMKRSKL